MGFHMSLFSFARNRLFALEPETAHKVTLAALNAMTKTGVSRAFFSATNLKVETKSVLVMGLDFPNRVGLAAGADKNGECIDGFGALGFGFLELGGVTPLAQAGNPQPRMFRLPEAQGIINRLGFNNLGVAALVANLKQHRQSGHYGNAPQSSKQIAGVIGVNLGKNKDTPNELALSDYAICYEQLYPLIDFATINVSSPNTAGLRALQEGDELRHILLGMKALQKKLSDKHGKYVPLSVKIAPDLESEQIKVIATLLFETSMDAVTATNTTVSRVAVQGLKHAEEAGGLSGRPVFEQSNRVIRALAAELQGALPIIGVGGIMSGEDAQTKIEAGASLVQFYTGLIYQGPRLVRNCIEKTRL